MKQERTVTVPLRKRGVQWHGARILGGDFDESFIGDSAVRIVNQALGDPLTGKNWPEGTAVLVTMTISYEEPDAGTTEKSE